MARTTHLEWHGDAVKKALNASVERRLTLAAMSLQKFIRENLSVDQPKYKPKKHKTRPRKGPAKYIGLSPSRPGEYPKRLSGQLLRSISWENVGKGVRRVGTNLRYGRWLETGTRKMLRRPWLSLAIRQHARFMQAILEAGAPL